MFDVDKEYGVMVCFGICIIMFDVDGEIVEECDVLCGEEEVCVVCLLFLGSSK